jgi:hypothetical protein
MEGRVQGQCLRVDESRSDGLLGRSLAQQKVADEPELVGKEKDQHCGEDRGSHLPPAEIIDRASDIADERLELTRNLWDKENRGNSPE